MSRLLGKKDGFSLLEIMIAIAILSISLLVLLDFQGQTMVVGRRAERISIATMLARQKMAEFELELTQRMKKGQFPDEESEEGKFEEPYEDYSWQLVVKRVELPLAGGEREGAVLGALKGMLKQISEMVREVRLTITWQELGKEQGFDVVTHIVNL